MAGSRAIEELLRFECPHTLNALTKLVMAMAAVTNNAGKKTWFGHDKGEQAYSKFKEALKVTLNSMVLDGLIRESSSSEEAAEILEHKIENFSLAFPNWPDAYGFAAFFFGGERSDAIATIERMRSSL